MTDVKLERARALMREDADKRSGSRTTASSSGDNASYPFWNIPDNSSATLRFLPDANDANPWFWAERQTIRLPFQGVVGGDYPTDRRVEVTVPCVDMFGDTCPIIATTRPWWKDDSKKEIARLYYKKRSYITQGFVVSSPFEETNVPDNPIRRFMLGSSLLNKIKAGLADPDMEHYPTDYLNGCDFRIRKTKKQDFNNYDTSEWARRSRPLSEAERLAIEQHKLFNLEDYKGARPDADGIAVIKAMFEASLRGEPFDHQAFGKYYRPFDNGATRGSSEEADSFDSAVKVVSKAASKLSEDVGHAESVMPTQPAASVASDADTQELLATLRARTSTRK